MKQITRYASYKYIAPQFQNCLLTCPDDDTSSEVLLHIEYDITYSQQGMLSAYKSRVSPDALMFVTAAEWVSPVFMRTFGGTLPYSVVPECMVP